MENSAASAPVNILHAECNACPEYMKKKNAFRYLFQIGCCILLIISLIENLEAEIAIRSLEYKAKKEERKL